MSNIVYVIRIGPAGWQYKDWQGIVYPSPKPRGFRELSYIATLFDTVEINTSFYGPPRPNTTQLGGPGCEQSPVSLHGQTLERLHSRSQRDD